MHKLLNSYHGLACLLFGYFSLLTMTILVHSRTLYHRLSNQKCHDSTSDKDNLDRSKIPPPTLVLF